MGQPAMASLDFGKNLAGVPQRLILEIHQGEFGVIGICPAPLPNPPGSATRRRTTPT
jgi:hypothetical protein